MSTKESETNELSPIEQEILAYADQLMEDAPEKFPVIASEILAVARYPLDDYLLRKIFLKKDELLEQGEPKLAYKYFKLYGKNHRHGSFYEREYEDDFGNETFHYKVLNKLLEQGDHKTAFECHAERFGLAYNNNYLVGTWFLVECGLPIGQEEISWFEKFSKCALKQNDLNKARFYAYGRIRLLQISEFPHEDEEGNFKTLKSDNNKLSDISDFKEAVKAYEDLADIALAMGRNVEAIKILQDIEGIYSKPFADEPCEWLDQDDMHYYGHICYRLKQHGDSINLESVFEKMKSNFASQALQTKPGSAYKPE